MCFLTSYIPFYFIIIITIFFFFFWQLKETSEFKRLTVFFIEMKCFFNSKKFFLVKLTFFFKLN